MSQLLKELEEARKKGIFVLAALVILKIFKDYFNKLCILLGLLAVIITLFNFSFVKKNGQWLIEKRTININELFAKEKPEVKIK